MASNKRAYLFRNEPRKVNKTAQALRANRIYIGWKKARRLIDPDLTDDKFKAAISAAYPDYSPAQLGKANARLWEFFREMRPGELLVVAPKDRERQDFYLAHVAGPPRLYTGDDPDIGFERRVTWLNDKQPYSRSDISGRLNNILMERTTSRVIRDADVLRELESLTGGPLLYPDEVASGWEGTKLQVVVNKYERDSKTRAACIRIHGLQCVVCGFDFQSQYGEAGAGLIHVHHLTPISQIGRGYRVNPKTDLRPVCPNCHVIIHKSRQRTLTIQQAKRLVQHRFAW